MKNVKLEIKTVIRSRTARSVIYGKDRGNMIWLSGMLQTKKEKEVIAYSIWNKYVMLRREHVLSLATLLIVEAAGRVGGLGLV